MSLPVYESFLQSVGTQCSPEHCLVELSTLQGEKVLREVVCFGNRIGFQTVQQILGIRCIPTGCRYGSDSKWHFYYRFEPELPELPVENIPVRIIQGEIQAFIYTGQTCGMQRARLSTWTLQRNEDTSLSWVKTRDKVEV